MSKHEILAHLAALLLLAVAGGGIYAWQKSPAMVPALTGYLDRDSLRLRNAAMARLRELGEAARPAVPRMLELAADPRSRDVQSAAGALARIDLARRAAEILGGFGLLARAAVPELIAAAASTDALVRDRSLTAWGHFAILTAKGSTAAIGRLAGRWLR